MGDRVELDGTVKKKYIIKRFQVSIEKKKEKRRYVCKKSNGVTKDFSENFQIFFS